MTKASALDLHDDWHGRETSDVLASLNTSVDGLISEEAAARLERDGPNRLPEGVRRTAITRFLMQFHNLLIYVLLASAVVSRSNSKRPGSRAFAAKRLKLPVNCWVPPARVAARRRRSGRRADNQTGASGPAVTKRRHEPGR